MLKLFGKKKKTAKRGRSAKKTTSGGGSRRRRLRFAFYLTLALAVAGVGYAFYHYTMTSDRFHVKMIYVRGARVLSEVEIVEKAGVTTADHILLVDAEAVQERVNAMPYVKECTVRRSFPDSVEISVIERVPVATIVVHNVPYEVDNDCVALRPLGPGDPYPGPLITELPESGTIEAGRPVKAAALQSALAVWHAFSGTKMARSVTVSEIAAREGNNVGMFCDELPYEIRWGDNFERQAQRLDVLWAKKGWQLECKEYLDLRFGPNLASR
ncbi:MAG: FtsQ-type POTRA domain-containing protein [bacterium]|nr:FtsQ-type POTRA domain-containing protein [bacterium]